MARGFARTACFPCLPLLLLVLCLLYLPSWLLSGWSLEAGVARRTILQSPQPRADPAWSQAPPPLQGPVPNEADRVRSNRENVAVREFVREMKLRREKEARADEAAAVNGGGDTTTWVSMAVCFNKNTHMHDKSKYPYAAVTPLAILLGKHFTDVKVTQTFIRISVLPCD